MRFYLDCEFDETPADLKLISIALVCEDGREFYAVSSEVELDDCNAWVQEHVWPVVFMPDSSPCLIASRDEIRRQIVAFVGTDKPEFWGYVAAYDWFLLCRLFGTLMDLPGNWPHICLDLKQEARRLEVKPKDLVPAEQPEHNALADARWMRKVHQALDQREFSMRDG